VLTDVAREIGTDYIAHGCTGKGNDQVRIELAINSLMDKPVIIDPIRDNNLSRDEEIRWLSAKGIVIEVTKEKPYSIDQNIWGRSVCAGVLENIDVIPPEEVFDWTTPLARTPDKPVDIEIGFKSGTPVSLNGKTKRWREIIQELNILAGQHGIGRIDHIEDRVVGIKSREIYEAPAAITLIKAHQVLESITLARAALNFKKTVDNEYANLIYQGYWFSNHHMDLVAYIQHNQKHVTGTVGLRLFKGNIIVTKRDSKFSLYNQRLATYTGESIFDQTAAKGFISIYGMENRILARKQLFNFSEETKLLEDKPEGKHGS
jgi:argininosuccinate synthase